MLSVQISDQLFHCNVFLSHYLTEFIMQSEDFLNLFTLNSLTPRPAPQQQHQHHHHQQQQQQHQQQHQQHQQQQSTQASSADNSQNNADIIRRINLLLGDSLDLANLNFNMPLYSHKGENQTSKIRAQIGWIPIAQRENAHLCTYA